MNGLRCYSIPMISIIHNNNGRVETKFNGIKKGDRWTLIDESDWPDPNPADNEIPQYFYDEVTGEITVEYKIVEDTDNI